MIVGDDAQHQDGVAVVGIQIDCACELHVISGREIVKYNKPSTSLLYIDGSVRRSPLKELR